MKMKQTILFICEVLAVIAKAWIDRDTTADHRRNHEQTAQKRRRRPRPKR